jgi:iron-sulfur cluster repair protein YtfE (RIC family)
MMNDTKQLNGAPTSVDPGINPEETINDLVARRPELMPVLQRFGFDLCCGGGLALREAAERHDVPLEGLLFALSEVPARAAR